MNQNLISNLNYIFDNMEEAVFVTNKLGGIQYLNRSAKKLFDINEGYLGNKIGSYFH